MTVKDIISGESEFIEFKQEVPKKSEVYMKTVVAFANGSGGKIVFISDATKGYGVFIEKMLEH